MHKKTVITSEKIIEKAAEAVWAANKYFVMACSQTQYRQISKAFRPDQRNLLYAYRQLSHIDHVHQTVASADLPELSNALYHVAGYFKKELSNETRQTMNEIIATAPETALQDLKNLAFIHQKTYLKPCRLWQRQSSFNEVPISMKINGFQYDAYTWKWYGNYVMQHQRW